MNGALLNKVSERLRTSPLRLTRKRKRILGALMAFEHPVSAAELRNQAQLPESDLVTVYRTLEAFEGIGIVQRIPLDTNGHLFELTAPDDHHHHLLCIKCHKAERIDRCIGGELEEEARKRGFSAVKHVMEVYGICADCAVIDS
ncbi:MAG: Fur family transcriptional regulator [Oceanipulchritudo sp.]